MAHVTMWAWESVLQDDCYEIVLGPMDPVRPLNNSDRDILNVRAAALMKKIEQVAPSCTHDMTVVMYAREWRNWFRKREWKHCMLCDRFIE